MTTDTPSKRAERERGFKDGFQLFELLRTKWPNAFPLKSHEIRPLANGAHQALIEEFGWSLGYAYGVLAAWKIRLAYCQAILRYPTRINLDGSASDEEVSDISRQQAKTQLERHAARQAKKAAAEQEKLRAAADANAEPKTPTPEAPAIVIPDEKAATPAAPHDPPKSGKLVVAGSAAMQAALKRRLASGAVTTEVLKTVATAKPKGRREQRAR
jgi:sRNA-binding protein